MRLCRSIAGSFASAPLRLCAMLCLCASVAALADGWVHSPDGGRTIDRIAQPMPRSGVNQITGLAQTIRPGSRL